MKNKILDDLKRINKKIQARDIEYTVLLRWALNLLNVYDRDDFLDARIFHTCDMSS